MTFSTSTTSQKTWIWIGAISCWLFFILELATERWFSSRLLGYNWLLQSISFFGHEGSLVEQQVKIWGIAFFSLLSLFGLGLYQALKPHKWALICGLFLLLYGLGEGLGSGLFPPNAPGTPYSNDAFYHDLFSGIGDIGLVLLPIVLLKIFPKERHPFFYKYLWVVIVVGFLMLAFFLMAKFAKPQHGPLMYKGFWQRVYMFNYYVLLLVLSFRMIKSSEIKK